MNAHIVSWAVLLLAWTGFCGETYYLSADGNDAADGRSPANAWRTLAKLSRDLPGGAEARLRRGDVFFGQLRLKHGPNARTPTRVAAWGEGPKPVVSLYKIVRNDPGVWRQSGEGLWTLDLARPGVLSGNPSPKNNIGFIRADGVIHGFRKFADDPLAADWDFREDGSQLTVRLGRNPAEAARDIRLAPRVNGIPFVRNAVVESLVVCGTGAHGANGVGENMVFRDCEFREIGGSELYCRNGRHVRYGNGVECWAGSTRIRVENCAFSDVYDVAFTMQGRKPPRSWEDVSVTGCEITRCTQAFEIWTTQCAPGVGMARCAFAGNRCVDTGRCWGYDARPNKACSAPLLVYAYQSDTCDILVTSNTFVNSRLALVHKPGGLGKLPPGYRIVLNRVIGDPSTPIGNPNTNAADATREAEIRKANTFSTSQPITERTNSCQVSPT